MWTNNVPAKSSIGLSSDVKLTSKSSAPQMPRSDTEARLQSSVKARAGALGHYVVLIQDYSVTDTDQSSIAVLRASKRDWLRPEPQEDSTQAEITARSRWSPNRP